jgi:hypothetical protein
MAPHRIGAFSRPGRSGPDSKPWFDRAHLTSKGIAGITKMIVELAQYLPTH